MDPLKSSAPDGGANRPEFEYLITSGWTKAGAAGFVDHVGPIWQRQEGSVMAFGFRAEPHHHNRRGIVQGGMIATLADFAMGLTARQDDPERLQATIQLDIQYIGAAKIGEFVTARCEPLRRTRHLVFMRGQITAEDRLVAGISGVWKKLGV